MRELILFEELRGAEGLKALKTPRALEVGEEELFDSKSVNAALGRGDRGRDSVRGASRPAGREGLVRLLPGPESRGRFRALGGAGPRTPPLHPLIPRSDRGSFGPSAGFQAGERRACIIASGSSGRCTT